MKRFLSLSLLFAGTAYLSSSGAALFPYQPPSAIYMTVGGGVSWFENSDWYRNPNNPGLLQVQQPSSTDNMVGSVNAAIGYQFQTFPMRAEVAYRWFDQADYTWDVLYMGYDNHDAIATIGSEAVLFNLYYDFYNKTRFTPFIGAGVGYYRNHSSFGYTFISSGKPSDLEDNTDDGTAWAAFAGVKYEITPNWLIDIRAEYLDLGFVQLYEDTSATNPTGSRRGQMKTDDFYAISALLNITYTYNFL